MGGMPLMHHDALQRSLIVSLKHIKFEHSNSCSSQPPHTTELQSLVAGPTLSIFSWG